MVQWWKRTSERPRGGLYDAMPVHPGPGATKMEWVWVQAVVDCLDGYSYATYMSVSSSHQCGV